MERLTGRVNCQGKKRFTESRHQQNTEDQEAHGPAQPEIARVLAARRGCWAITRVSRFSLFGGKLWCDHGLNQLQRYIVGHATIWLHILSVDEVLCPLPTTP